MGLLDGKTALVVGVANKKSIAWGITRALHAQGATIGLMCMESNMRRAKKLAGEIGTDLIIPCDVRSDNDIKQGMILTGEAFDGKLDILIHAVAYANYRGLEGEFLRTSKADWNLALEVSAYSFLALSRQAVPLMKSAGGGSIICLTFRGGELVVPGYNIMGVAKAALDMTMRYLANDLGPDNIRVNAISPGPISTASSIMIKDFEKALGMVEERAPLLRNITLQDIGGAAVFLSSDLSQMVTGSVIKVDSGMHIMASPTLPHYRLGEKK